MKKHVKIRPSLGEIAILTMLWQEGPLCLMEAHRKFGHYGKAVSYPTMQTRLNRLAAKGWVKRSNQRPSRYATIITAEQVATGHFEQWLRVAKRASVAPLIANLISESPLTPKEIQEIKKLLSEAEKNARAEKKQGA